VYQSRLAIVENAIAFLTKVRTGLESWEATTLGASQEKFSRTVSVLEAKAARAGNTREELLPSFSFVEKNYAGEVLADAGGPVQFLDLHAARELLVDAYEKAGAAVFQELQTISEKAEEGLVSDGRQQGIPSTVCVLRQSAAVGANGSKGAYQLFLGLGSTSGPVGEPLDKEHLNVENVRALLREHLPGAALLASAVPEIIRTLKEGAEKAEKDITFQGLQIVEDSPAATDAALAKLQQLDSEFVQKLELLGLQTRIRTKKASNGVLADLRERVPEQVVFADEMWLRLFEKLIESSLANLKRLQETVQKDARENAQEEVVNVRFTAVLAPADLGGPASDEQVLLTPISRSWQTSVGLTKSPRNLLLLNTKLGLVSQLDKPGWQEIRVPGEQKNTDGRFNPVRDAEKSLLKVAQTGVQSLKLDADTGKPKISQEDEFTMEQNEARLWQIPLLTPEAERRQFQLPDFVHLLAEAVSSSGAAPVFDHRRSFADAAAVQAASSFSEKLSIGALLENKSVREALAEQLESCLDFQFWIKGFEAVDRWEPSAAAEVRKVRDRIQRANRAADKKIQEKIEKQRQREMFRNLPRHRTGDLLTTDYYLQGDPFFDEASFPPFCDYYREPDDVLRVGALADFLPAYEAPPMFDGDFYREHDDVTRGITADVFSSSYPFSDIGNGGLIQPLDDDDGVHPTTSFGSGAGYGNGDDDSPVHTTSFASTVASASDRPPRQPLKMQPEAEAKAEASFARLQVADVKTRDLVVNRQWRDPSQPLNLTIVYIYSVTEGRFGPELWQKIEANLQENARELHEAVANVREEKESPASAALAAALAGVSID